MNGVSGSLKIAIIGAGWAGLAAAITLSQKENVQISLFEAGKVAGGRARSVAVEQSGFSFLDNGQHLLIGAYQQVFDFIQQIGIQIDDVLLRQNMRWHLHDGIQFHTPRFLPAPFNLLTGVLGAKGASLSAKLRLLHQMNALNIWRNKRHLPDQTVEQWLNKQGVTKQWQTQFWQPLVWGALNTPLQTASLRILANVLHDGVFRARKSSQYCLPKTDLGRVFVEPALTFLAQNGVDYVANCRIGKIIHENQKFKINDDFFDRVIIATAPYHVLGLLPENWADDVFQAALQKIKYHAITTVYLKFNENIALPHVMTGFADGVVQWLINRRDLNGENELAAVISVSDQYEKTNTQQWLEYVLHDIKKIMPDLPSPIATQVITEKRATIAAECGRIPPNALQFADKGLILAGDYLNPHYPATLETAVQSGKRAAQHILHFQAA